MSYSIRNFVYWFECIYSILIKTYSSSITNPKVHSKLCLNRNQKQTNLTSKKIFKHKTKQAEEIKFHKNFWDQFQHLGFWIVTFHPYNYIRQTCQRQTPTFQQQWKSTLKMMRLVLVVKNFSPSMKWKM